MFHGLEIRKRISLARKHLIISIFISKNGRSKEKVTSVEPIKLLKTFTFLDSFLCIVISSDKQLSIQRIFSCSKSIIQTLENMNGRCFNPFIAEFEHALFPWILDKSFSESRHISKFS